MRDQFSQGGARSAFGAGAPNANTNRQNPRSAAGESILSGLWESFRSAFHKTKFFWRFAVGTALVVGCAADAGGPTGKDESRAPQDPSAQSTSVALSSAAGSRIRELRARFRAGPTKQNSVIGEAIATDFVQAGTDRVRPVLPTGAKHAVRRGATVELATHASGAIRVEDDTSRVAISFALQGTSDALVSVSDGLAVYAGALSGADVVERVSAEGAED